MVHASPLKAQHGLVHAFAEFLKQLHAQFQRYSVPQAYYYLPVRYKLSCIALEVAHVV